MNNASLVYAMLLPDAITVKVRYVMSYNGKEPSNQPVEYTYKALISMGLKAGDIVVVPIRFDGEIVMRTAIVLSVDEFLDVNSTKEYHWVVQKIDSTAYDALREKEKVVAKHMQLADRERQRKELLAQLALSYESENAMRKELGLELVKVDDPKAGRDDYVR